MAPISTTMGHIIQVSGNKDTNMVLEFMRHLKNKKSMRVSGIREFDRAKEYS